MATAVKAKEKAPQVIALALLSLLLVAATPSEHTWPDEHQESAGHQPDEIQHQQIEIQAAIEGLSSTLRESEQRLIEAIDKLRHQQEVEVEQHHADQESWNSPSVFVQVGLLVVGALYTFFAWLQWSAIHRQADISEKAADAASQSAEVAKVALLASRPYLLINGATIRGWHDRGEPHEPGKAVRDFARGDFLEVSFSLMNYGKGPAIIERISTCLETVKGKRHYPMIPDGLPNPRDYSGYLPLHLGLIVLGVDAKPFDFSTDKIWSNEVIKDRDAIGSGEKQLVAHGRIHYRDVLGHEWETGFLWMFWPASLLQGDIDMMNTSRMEIGPKECNYNT